MQRRSSTPRRCTATAPPSRSSAPGWPPAASATGSSWPPRPRRGTKEHPLAAGEIRAGGRAVAAQPADRPIDLYYAHYDDETTPLEETLTAFDELVRAGKVRYVAASNYSAERLTRGAGDRGAAGRPRYVALQPHYNLMERAVYEDELRDVVAEHGHGRRCPTSRWPRVSSPASTGPASRSTRRARRARRPTWGSGATACWRRCGEVADAQQGVPVPAVALRWLADQPTVVAPIASGRTVEQLADLLPMQDLVLTDDERQPLTDASA